MSGGVTISSAPAIHNPSQTEGWYSRVSTTFQNKLKGRVSKQDLYEFGTNSSTVFHISYAAYHFFWGSWLMMGALLLHATFSIELRAQLIKLWNIVSLTQEIHGENSNLRKTRYELEQTSRNLKRNNEWYERNNLRLEKNNARLEKNLRHLEALTAQFAKELNRQEKLNDQYEEKLNRHDQNNAIQEQINETMKETLANFKIECKAALKQGTKQMRAIARKSLKTMVRLEAQIQQTNKVTTKLSKEQKATLKTLKKNVKRLQKLPADMILKLERLEKGIQGLEAQKEALQAEIALLQGVVGELQEASGINLDSAKRVNQSLASSIWNWGYDPYAASDPKFY